MKYKHSPTLEMTHIYSNSPHNKQNNKCTPKQSPQLPMGYDMKVVSIYKLILPINSTKNTSHA